MHRCSWLVILLFRLDNCPDNHFSSKTAFVYPFYGIHNNSTSLSEFSIKFVKSIRQSLYTTFPLRKNDAKNVRLHMYRLSTQLWYFPGAPFVFGIWDAHFDWQANCWALWHKRHSNHRVVFTDNCPVVESYTRSLRTNKSPKSLTKFWSQGFTKHYWLAKIGRRFWKLKLQESLVKKTGAKNQPWSLKLICWKTFQSQFYHSLLSQ